MHSAELSSEAKRLQTKIYPRLNVAILNLNRAARELRIIGVFSQLPFPKEVYLTI